METNPYTPRLSLYEPNIIRTQDNGISIVKCHKCSGTGIYMYPHSCWTCNGTGEAVFESMTERQIKYIRTLFKVAQTKLTDEQSEYIIQLMKLHIAETLTVDKYWASALINYLKRYQQ
jgi:RecJ-like exonuclease